ncbi:MAG: hypothetical protein HOA57_01890 [Candidatus Magasanikbacteria bacterium]|jgi:hypothetical protein|nr:hypothetical protein [Candidatus Magasanikbacteria bacterium]MBT4315230.1 hypothetical protein [Candidatus Magasanikbacteria bacterium]MBT4547124.1 hypothetical protein [Candidatus Magasanikbacteria bacterium]MBT6819106.1 hypothetical protein [Candidatus Magasanikbacteria bacterium]
MSDNILKKPSKKELEELNKLMVDPRKRLEILKEFNRLMEEFFVWQKQEKNKQKIQKQDKSMIGKLLEKIKKM